VNKRKKKKSIAPFEYNITLFFHLSQFSSDFTLKISRIILCIFTQCSGWLRDYTPHSVRAVDSSDLFSFVFAGLSESCLHRGEVQKVIPLYWGSGGVLYFVPSEAFLGSDSSAMCWTWDFTSHSPTNTEIQEGSIPPKTFPLVTRSHVESLNPFWLFFPQVSSI
jgi:hypothetical protein